MAKSSNIAWTRSTFNPWIGCTKVSPGCERCYASVSTPARALGVEWGAGKPRRRTSKANWALPLRWNEQAAQEDRDGVRWHPDMPAGFWPVFCASLGDVFDNEVPEEWRVDLFDLIFSTPHLTWLLLTKRIGNVAPMMSAIIPDGLWPHFWLGVTVVNQAEADRDIPKLLATPAARRFVSYEPALESVDFRGLRSCRSCGHFPVWRDGLECEQCSHDPAPGALVSKQIDWVIVGGESKQRGMRARPFYVHWARSTVEQCRMVGTAVFVKQLGSFVIDRNDAGFVGDGDDLWPAGTDDKLIHDPFGRVEKYQGAPVRIKLCDRAGADPAEWPEDIRIQEFPR